MKNERFCATLRKYIDEEEEEEEEAGEVVKQMFSRS